MDLDLINHPLIGKCSLKALLAIAGMIGPVVLIICDIVTGLAAPGYNFIINSISSLAWTDLGWIQTIGFLAIGLLVELFVAGLFFSLHGKRAFAIGLGIFVLFGFGLLMIGAFHTDLAGGTRTIEGFIHISVAKVVFWLFPIAALLLSQSMKHDPNWNLLYKYTLFAALFAVLLMISSIIWLPEESGWFGLFERILVLDEIIWVEIMAYRLLAVSLKKSEAFSQKPLQLQ
jgi:hypothetical protein